MFIIFTLNLITKGHLLLTKVSRRLLMWR